MSAKDLFLGYIRAYNAKDVSAMLTFFDEGCVFENVSGGKVTVRTEGKAELEALARQSAEAFASREQKVVSLTQGQGRIVAEIDYLAVLQADLTPDLKTGSRLDLRGVSVLELSGGKIARLTDYSWMRTAPNHWVQATPGCALLLFLSQWPGAPDPARWASYRVYEKRETRSP
jgi:hypothetical protein